MNRLATAALIFTTACAEPTVQKTTTSDTIIAPDQLDQPVVEPKSDDYYNAPTTPENTEKGGYVTPDVELARRMMQQQKSAIHNAIYRCIENASDPKGFFDKETKELIPPCPDSRAQIWL